MNVILLLRCPIFHEELLLKPGAVLVSDKEAEKGEDYELDMPLTFETIQQDMPGFRKVAILIVLVRSQ